MESASVGEPNHPLCGFIAAAIGLPKGGRAVANARKCMKKRGLWFACALLVTLLFCAAASAADEPVTAAIELEPSHLTSPGAVQVSITVSNTTNEDLKDPVILLDPAGQTVADFGTEGQAMLKAGESLTWQGSYDVSEKTLQNGLVTYYIRYTSYLDSGEAVEKSAPVQAKIESQKADVLLEVKRTITPAVAQEKQEVKVVYYISNSGTVALNDIVLQENKDVNSKKQKIPQLKAGQAAEITFNVTMGKKDLTSGATIQYYAEGSKKKLTYTVENQKIQYGNSELTAKLTSSAKGAVTGGVVTLTLTLKNKGSIDFSDIRVTDPVLGDVFTNQELKAGKTLELTKDVTVTENGEYQFTVTAMDASGAETTAASEAVSVTAMDPADTLNLTLTASADETEVYGAPATVRFALQIANTGKVDATAVKVLHGDVELASYETIQAGKTLTLHRDAALSRSGKYQFTVTAQDPLENELSFESNEMQIAVYAPTPVPATPTPAPVPTAEPTFVPATFIPIRDESVGAVPKAIQSVLLPLLIVAGVVLVASCALLLVAAKRRADQKRASEAAYDHLERARRRDYITPAEEQIDEEDLRETGAEPKKSKRRDPKEQEAEMKNRRLVGEDREEAMDWELPHMKYARDAAEEREEEDESGFQMKHTLFDDETEDAYAGFDRPEAYGEEEYSSRESDGASYAADAEYGDPYYGDDSSNEPVYDDVPETYGDEGYPVYTYDPAQEGAEADGGDPYGAQTYDPYADYDAYGAAPAAGEEGYESEEQSAEPQGRRRSRHARDNGSY